MSNPLTVLFATTTGNAEDCASRAAKKLRTVDHAPRLANMRDFPAEAISQPGTFMLVVSTWGDGEPPDDAIPFWENLQKLPEGSLANRRFAVLSLGNKAHEQFYGFARACDEVLPRLGGYRLSPCVDCGLNHEELLDDWIEQIVSTLDTILPPTPQ